MSAGDISMEVFVQTEKSVQAILDLFSLGAFSIGKYLLLVGLLSFLLVGLPVAIAAARGAGSTVAKSAGLHVVIGVACALGVLTAPACLYFVPKGYFIAFFGEAERT